MTDKELFRPMRLQAKWSGWSEWIEGHNERYRRRELLIANGIAIATLEMCETRETHIWGKGTFYSLRVGHEASYPVFKTLRGAMGRLRKIK